jgi:hypothetical protein
MTKRTASFTGSDGATWPAVTKASGGTDSWTASYWGSTPALSVVESLVTAISTNRTAFGLGINTIPSVYGNGVFDSGTDAATFNVPTAAGATLPNYLTVPIGPAILFVMSAHIAQHYHEIDIVNCTNQFRYPYSGKTLTYTRFADYGWTATISTVLTYFRMTAWIVSNGDTTRAAGRVRVNACSSPGRSAYTTTSGNAGATTTAPLNSTLTVQTWHGHVVGIYGADDGGTGNWEAGIRTANMATTTDTTATATVTLPSTLTKSNNRVLGFFGRAASTTSVVAAAGPTGGNSTVLSIANNSSPNSTSAAVLGAIGSTTDGTARKAQKSAAVTIGSSGTQFYGFGVEIVDSSTAQGDTFPSNANSYIALGLLPANNATHSDGTTSRNVEVTVTASSASAYRYGLVTRYCTHIDGKKYGIHFSNLDASGTSGSGHYALRASYLIDGAGETTMAYYDIGTVAPGTFRNIACRAVQSAGGGIWLTMKAWIDGVSEPAWPTSESTVSSKDTSNSAAQWAILNAVDNGSVAQIIAGYAGQVGIWGTVTPADSLNTPVVTGAQSINAMTDLSIATGSATITGSGGASVPTDKIYGILRESVTLSSTTSEIAVGVIVREVASVTLDSSAGTLTAASTPVLVASPTITASSTLTAGTLIVGRTTSTLTGTADLEASAIVVAPAVGTLSGSSTFENVASIGVLPTTASLSGSTNDDGVVAVEVLPATASLSGASDLTAESIIASLQVALSATSTLSASGRTLIVVSAGLAATSSLSAIGETGSTTTLSGATGALTATADRVLVATASLSGSSSATVATDSVLVTEATANGTSGGSSASLHLNVVTASSTGAGVLVGDATHINVTQGAATGAGSLTCDATHINVVQVTCAGQGNVDVNVTVEMFAESVLQGVSTLAIATQGVLYETPSLAAIGQMVVEGRWVHFIPDTLRETYSLKIGNSVASTTIPPLQRAQRNVEMYVSTRKAIVGSYTTIALDE